jgi:ferritin-like metal-binding protein YciE
MPARKSASVSAEPRGTKKKYYGPSERKMAKGENLFHDLLIAGLKDIYWAEKHLIKSLPKLAKATTTQELKTSINDHLPETEMHVKKLERIFELIGEKAGAKRSQAMEGLVKEATGVQEEIQKETYTRDAAIIMAIQKIEHYQIASYGSLKEIAKTMGHDEVVSILDEILAEEKKADARFTELAIGSINEMARGEWTKKLQD